MCFWDTPTMENKIINITAGHVPHQYRRYCTIPHGNDPNAFQEPGKILKHDKSDRNKNNLTAAMTVAAPAAKVICFRPVGLPRKRGGFFGTSRHAPTYSDDNERATYFFQTVAASLNRSAIRLSNGEHKITNTSVHMHRKWIVR